MYVYIYTYIYIPIYIYIYSYVAEVFDRHAPNVKIRNIFDLSFI